MNPLQEIENEELHEAMLAEYEQIAESRDWVWLDFGNGVRVREPRSIVLRFEQPLQFDVIEGEQVEVVIGFAEKCELNPQRLFIPAGVERQLIIGDIHQELDS